MATINVRRLDEKVVQRLKERAASNDRSLESEVRTILEKAAQDQDMRVQQEKFLEESRKLSELTRGRYQTPSEDLIREDRDRGHRDFDL